MRYQTVALTFAALVFGSVLAIPARADLWNHKTIVDFSEPVELPGKVLPAGKYVFKLMDSPSDRHITQVWNANESQIEGTFLTVPDRRLHATGKTVMNFSERPAGTPEALKAWFYPGARVGEEFVYPHDRAGELAKANHVPVYSTRADMSSHMTQPLNSAQDPGAVEMQKAPVKALQPTGEEIDIIELYKLPNSGQQGNQSGAQHRSGAQH